MFHVIILVLICLIFFSFLWRNNNFFRISWSLIRYRLWFHNFMSNSVSCKFSWGFNCFMNYFLEAIFRASSTVLCSHIQSIAISHEWQKSISLDIFSCSWFYRIAFHFYLLLSNEIWLLFLTVYHFICKRYNNFINFKVLSFQKH